MSARGPTYLKVLAAVFAAVWVLLSINPSHRSTWVLENLLVVFMVTLLGVTRRVFPLSGLSYTLIFLFMMLHQVGAHYTYAEVPYDEWSTRLFGRSFNSIVGWERNNFDRVVHFAYGLLLSYPIREVFLRIVNVRGFWGYFLPLDLAMSTSMIFELLEWAAAEIFGEGLGQSYLGTQGDEWDAHKDMALASLGAMVAMCIVILVNLRLQPQFSEEWSDSFRIKRRTPLGEHALKTGAHDLK